MTKSICSLCLVLALALNPFFSYAGSLPANNTTELRERISRVMSYPESLQAAHAVEIVLVSFEIQACGMITVIDTDASNPEFEAYVIRKLESMRFDTQLQGVHHMRFTFKAQ